MQKSTLTLIVLAVLSITAGIYVQQSNTGTEPPADLKNTIILPSGRALSESPFTDHQGQAFGLDQLHGKWTIMFPGFTSCPDICPTTMQTLAGVKEDLQAAGKWGNYQVVLMSVDPQRDTAEKLAAYAAHFDPDFAAIRSDVASTEAFAKQIGVVFYSKEPDEQGNYDVEHSASILLINPAAEWVGAITTPFTRAEIVEDLSALHARYADDHVVTEKHAPPDAQEHAGQAMTKPSAPTGTVEGISLQHAWVRPPPPNASSAAAYFEINNNSDQDISIVAAESPQFEAAMIHDTSIDNGVAKMIHLASLEVPAGESVRLAPMSTHLMLHEPLVELEVGSLIEVSLITEGGGVINQQIMIQPQPE